MKQKYNSEELDFYPFVPLKSGLRPRAAAFPLLKRIRNGEQSKLLQRQDQKRLILNEIVSVEALIDRQIDYLKTQARAFEGYHFARIARQSSFSKPGLIEEHQLKNGSMKAVKIKIKSDEISPESFPNSSLIAYLPINSSDSKTLKYQKINSVLLKPNKEATIKASENKVPNIWDLIEKEDYFRPYEVEDLDVIDLYTDFQPLDEDNFDRKLVHENKVVEHLQTKIDEMEKRYKALSLTLKAKGSILKEKILADIEREERRFDLIKDEKETREKYENLLKREAEKRMENEQNRRPKPGMPW
mmetsp:Transcript_16201/g.24026  ORF Transcript_16201/g.24026 Transcript_16201/m.24026 type:complete len:301 (+) Transcript_16201:32-934(+)